MFLRRLALLKARKFNVAVEAVLNFRILALNFSRYPKICKFFAFKFVGQILRADRQICS